MLGRGDVGKVYLVREKKSGKLFAMKGASPYHRLALKRLDPADSPVEEGDDRAEKDQARLDGARDSRDGKPPLYRHPIPFIPIGKLPLLLHGVLYGRRVLPGSADAARKVSGGG